MHGKTDDQFFPPEIAAQFQENDRLALTSGICLNTIEQVPQEDGLHYKVVSKFPIIDYDGRVALVGGIAVDITDFTKAKEQLETESALRRAIENSMPGGVLAVDLKGRLTYVNPAFCKMVGWTREELVDATPPFIYWAPEELQSIQDAFARTLRGDTPPGGLELRFRRRNGERFAVLMTVSPLVNGERERQGWVASVLDITERKRIEGLVARQATHDPLTGLPNALLCEEKLEHALILARQSGESLALLRLDLDRFKIVNQTLGHRAGDLLMRDVATRLIGCLRETEVLARSGGDKFTLILSGADGPKAATVAQRLIDSLNSPFQVGGHEVFVTGSVGIALFPADGKDAHGLERCADSAMVAAKKQGRNRLQAFTAEMHVAASRRLAMETELHHALERGELSLAYQPRFHLETNRIAGVEALLRWESPKFGKVPSEMLISIAEESGLIAPISHWVMRQAASQGRAWLDAGYSPIKIGINVSAAQFARGDLTETVARTLSETGLGASWLDLEVTESLIMGNLGDSARQLRDLKALGVSVSLDDFGTGYSSLSYLQQLPIDNLKIDRSFVQSMKGAVSTWTLVQAIVGLAHSLRMTATAEGAETHRQVELLRKMGCDFGQSFFLGRPAAAGSMEAILQKTVAASQNPQPIIQNATPSTHLQ